MPMNHEANHKSVIASAVSNKSRDIRDCIKIGAIARSIARMSSVNIVTHLEHCTFHCFSAV